MIVKVVVPDSIYARVYFARGEQGAVGPTGNTGPQGPSGIVNVDSPITNSGTSTAANIGLNQALLQITPAQVTGTAVITTDSRLSDQRVPTDGSVTDTKIVAGGLSPNRITGTAVITTDSRLSDARTPLAHAASHGSAGSDPITIAQSQVTGLTSALAAKAPLDSPVFTTKVTLPVTSGTFLGTNSLGEIYKVAGAPGLGYIPYTASVGGGIAWLDSTLLTRDDQANTFTVGGHTITSESASVVPLVLKGASGQTGNLFELKNNAGTNLVQVNSAGLTSFTRATTITQTNVGEYLLRLVGASGQTGDYLQINNSSAQTLINVTSAGNLNATGQVRVGTTSGLAQLAVISAGATTIGAVVRGAASQSANLQEWQNSAGTVQALINPFGAAAFGTSSVLGRVSVSTGSTGTIGVVVRGVASQTANLQEWQNDAGTVQAKVTSAGQIWAPVFYSNQNWISMGDYNSGGVIDVRKLGVVGYNPGANRALLYFRDGTNAGTLKLVVRAGAAGAETTILDNIPT